MQVSSAYTRLLVSDLKACFFFYKDVMEFPVKVEDEKKWLCWVSSWWNEAEFI
jgi:hypothetical protein